jgi:hypothetical protein
MQVPDNIRDCCCFIYCDTGEGHKLVGTGFFVGEKVAEDGPENFKYVYLVTAKHIVAGIKCKTPIPNMGIRVNVSGGETIDIDIPINSWLFHPDDTSVDAAILPVWNMGGADIKTIPPDIAITDELTKKHGIGIGDEVCITGLFYKHYGNKRNLPILRIGNIAMMLGERIKTTHFGLIQAYLVELRSIGGLSGSPVFVHIVTLSPKMEHLLFWLGLMRGHWPTDKESIDTLDASDEQQLNVGIGIVVPASKILEITRQEFLMQAKEESKRKCLKDIHNK